jgi:hypothetical protein
MKQKLQEAIDLLEQLVYYSQIHTVSGVRPAGFDTHEEAWRKAQKFIYEFKSIIDEKHDELDEEFGEQEDEVFGLKLKDRHKIWKSLNS